MRILISRISEEKTLKLAVTILSTWKEQYKTSHERFCDNRKREREIYIDKENKKEDEGDYIHLSIASGHDLSSYRYYRSAGVTTNFRPGRERVD